MAITILGLGPGDAAYLTRQAWDVLSQASEVYLRTKLHPTVGGLPSHLRLHSFDHLYDTADDFTSLYSEIAGRILELGRRPEGVLYAVPGHPLVGETTVRLILDGARTQGLDVRIVEGLSFVEPTMSLLGLDGLRGVQLADATDLAESHYLLLDPDRPALVGQLYSQPLTSALKLTLMNVYPDDHPVTLVHAAGTVGSTATTVPLYELDRAQQVDHLTTLYVPPLQEVGGPLAFLSTVARLRAPGGCPWDQEQTHQSLRPGLLQETYEVLAALDEQDDDKLCEELGDLLMQIAMHAQIATEEGAFTFSNVVNGIDSKLKRRHPHVFGDLDVRDTDEVLRNWEAIKARERDSGAVSEAHRSRLDGLPITLPALARAQALSDRAARAGFDWPDVEGVLDKLAEEIGELRSAGDSSERAQELGDLLFTLVNVARWLDIDAESALRGACDRFTERYSEMERFALDKGVHLDDLTAAELDRLWERSKTRNRWHGL